jgi:hypothetical protein
MTRLDSEKPPSVPPNLNRQASAAATVTVGHRDGARRAAGGPGLLHWQVRVTELSVCHGVTESDTGRHELKFGTHYSVVAETMTVRVTVTGRRTPAVTGSDDRRRRAQVT